MNHMAMPPITYGYARVSKADDARNLETQLRILADHGIREDLIFSDVASGRTMNRTGWLDLLSRVQPGDTIVVAFLDRFSRNLEEGVRIQAELTGRDIGIVAVRENIDTTDEGPAAKFFRRSMLPQGAYQVDSASERIKLGLARARGNGKKVGRPPALTPDQIEQCRRMAEDGSGLRHIAPVMTCSPATVKKALAGPPWRHERRVDNGPDAWRKTYLNNIFRRHTDFSLPSAHRDMQPPVGLTIPVNIRSAPPNSRRFTLTGNIPAQSITKRRSNNVSPSRTENRHHGRPGLAHGIFTGSNPIRAERHDSRCGA